MQNSHGSFPVSIIWFKYHFKSKQSSNRRHVCWGAHIGIIPIYSPSTMNEGGISGYAVSGFNPHLSGFNPRLSTRRIVYPLYTRIRTLVLFDRQNINTYATNSFEVELQHIAPRCVVLSFVFWILYIFFCIQNTVSEHVSWNSFGVTFGCRYITFVKWKLPAVRTTPKDFFETGVWIQIKQSFLI